MEVVLAVSIHQLVVLRIAWEVVEAALSALVQTPLAIRHSTQVANLLLVLAWRDLVVAVRQDPLQAS